MLICNGSTVILAVVLVSFPNETTLMTKGVLSEPVNLRLNVNGLEIGLINLILGGISVQFIHSFKCQRCTKLEKHSVIKGPTGKYLKTEQSTRLRHVK